MYYAVSAFGSQASSIGYATSTTLEYGSWTDHGATGISSSAGKSYNAIDPNLIQSADGTYYMNFGSFWNDIYQVKMSSPTKSAGGSGYNIAFNATGTHAVEGSFGYYRAPYYYLFFSSGICCNFDTSPPAAGEEYKIAVCRSESVSGPYVDQNGVACLESGGTTVLASHGNIYGPGGQGVYADSSEHGAVLYYHYGESWQSLCFLCALLVRLYANRDGNSRHHHRVERWRLQVWMEQAELVHWLASCPIVRMLTMSVCLAFGSSRLRRSRSSWIYFYRVYSLFRLRVYSVAVRAAAQSIAQT